MSRATPNGKLALHARDALTSLALVAPSREWLREFELALAAGWSPNTEHDISAEQLRELRRDRGAYLEALLRGRTIRLSDGSVVPRLPFWEFWIVDGSFCGRIGLRFRRGTEALPPYALGHIGYAIVPWKRRLGYATEALRQILPYARAEGLSRVQITCDDDNGASQRVILANRGVAAGKIPHPTRRGHFKLCYWVPTFEEEPAEAAKRAGSSGERSLSHCQPRIDMSAWPWQVTSPGDIGNFPTARNSPLHRPRYRTIWFP